MTPDCYRLYDSVVSSTIPLGLPLAERDDFDYRFETGDRSALDCSPVAWYTRADLPDGTPYLSLGKSAEGYWLDFHGYACFHIPPDRRTITVYPQPGANARTIEHLFLDQVMPRLLSSAGKLVLHGAVVAGSDAVIALVGESGRGKSTLAASFWQAGYAVLSDDCVVLHETGAGYRVTPSYPGVRLWPDAAVSLLSAAGMALPTVSEYNRKVRWAGSSGPADPAPAALLKAVVLLAPPDDRPDAPVLLTRVTGCSVMLALLGNMFRLESAHTVMAEEFDRLTKFISTVVFYRLSYPRAYTQLPHVLQTIQATLGFN